MVGSILCVNLWRSLFHDALELGRSVYDTAAHVFLFLFLWLIRLFINLRPSENGQSGVGRFGLTVVGRFGLTVGDRLSRCDLSRVDGSFPMDKFI